MQLFAVPDYITGSQLMLEYSEEVQLLLQHVVGTACCTLHSIVIQQLILLFVADCGLLC